MFNLAGKCAVVVGGTSGIGKAIALGLALAGADVVASSRSKRAVNALANCLEARGSKTLRIPSDVVDRASLQHLHDAVISSFGHIDVLVNSAGVTKRVPTLDCPEELWQSIMDVNLNGTLRACQIFGKTMLKQQQGRIINIASLSTFVAFHEVAAYGASKAAVGALTRSLAVEWAPYGVCVNAIAPGHLPHRSQPCPARLTTRQGTSRENTHGSLWYRGRDRRHRDLPRLRRKRLYNRADHRHRRPVSLASGVNQ